MQELSFRRILKFWMPLSATWLMMSVEGPYLAAIIARMLEPKYNLAAYGVAFSFALIIESPIIMMMSASTALVKDSYSFAKLRNFTYSLNLIITCLILIFIIPPVFNFFALGLIKLPPDIAALTHTATILLIPWPASIGYRRFYQGIMIRYNLTRRVAYGTIVRLSSMTLTALVLYLFTRVPGAVVGASALSMGVVSEAIASRFMAAKIIKEVKQTPPKEESSRHLTYRGIIHFYYPLALTSILTLAVNPLITFSIGQSRMAIESLAVLPVINSFVFLFKSFGVSFQEAAIALLGEYKRSYRTIRNFALIMGCVSAGSLLILSAFSFTDLWFSGLSGLSQELTALSRPALLIMAILPGLEVLISFQRAVLVDTRKTKPITVATAIEVIGIIVVLFITVNQLAFIGVIAAASALLMGRLGANIYLFQPFLKSVRSNPEFAEAEV